VEIHRLRAGDRLPSRPRTLPRVVETRFEDDPHFRGHAAPAHSSVGLPLKGGLSVGQEPGSNPKGRSVRSSRVKRCYPALAGTVGG
jgi:hypothetical protein